MSTPLRSPETDDSTALRRQPIWMISAQVGVIGSVVLGFGALGVARPKLTILVLVVCVLGVVMFGPPRSLRRIVVSVPVVALMLWWIASYFWTFNIYGWRTETQNLVPLVAAAIILVSLLPTRQIQTALVAGCYVAIGYTVLQFLIHPGIVMSNPDGVPGWRGGFIHKNAMAPFMLFATLTLACFDRSTWRRRIGMFVAVVLVAMSQSTTSLSSAVVVFLAYLLLRRLSRSSSCESTSVIIAACGVAVLLGGLFSSIFRVLLGVSGKDPTLSRRTDIWAGVIEAIGHRPWLGYGPGGVWGTPGSEPAQSILNGLGFHVADSHNGFLEILLLLGIVGLALFVWLQVSTLRRAVRNFRSQPDIAIFVISYVVLTIMLSIAEVAFFGVWLVLLCAFNCWLLRIDLEHRSPIASGPAAQDNDSAVGSTARSSG